MNFPLDRKFLASIMRLDSDNTTAWVQVKQHLTSVAKESTDEILHGFPDTERNYDQRFHTMRGFCIAIDTIQNIFNNSEQLLRELIDQEEFQKSTEMADSGEGV